ncbi:MAG: 3'-5' exoribonuclease [Clostridia bacterium]|nr:3'-5' exoribonuclease [Clostridia bacterium]
MKYLAFDIEAANGYKQYSICSIGIVVSDTKFNILHRENVWINPKTKYNLNGTRKNVGIDLHLDKKLLDSSPDFSQVYGKICKLLTDKDTVVIGHAVDSDVRMLNETCKHYKLPSINFNFVCSQLLYKLYKGDKEVKALNKIAADLQLNYREHNSEDDAWMSLMTVKYLVEQTDQSLEQLLATYQIRIGSNHNFEIVRPASLLEQVSKKSVTKVAIDKIKAYAAKVKVQSNQHKGKVFALARSIELDESLAMPAIYQIVSGGGKYTTKLNKSNYYVAAPTQTAQDVNRERFVNQLVEDGLCQVITLNQLLPTEKDCD